MSINYVHGESKPVQFCKDILYRIKNNSTWVDLVGICSLIIYIFISIDAILAVKVGLTTYDSTKMLEMARGERIMSTGSSPFYILYLRVVLGLFGDAGILYAHYLAAAITGLTLVWVFGRKNILSWSGFWLLSMPSYVFFNLIVWRDVLFMYLVCISIVLIIKSDRDRLNLRRLYVIITILLTTICLVRLNGGAVACIVVIAFLTNKKNVRNKLSSLVLALVLAAGVNLYIKNHYEVIQSTGKTTKALAVRMVENDYLYYMFCIARQDVAGLRDQRNKIYAGLPSYCTNSYTLDVARASLSTVERKNIYNAGLDLFLRKPYLWVGVKYRESLQYFNVRGAFIFPTDVSRLNAFNKDSKYFMRSVSWAKNNYGSIVKKTFFPVWVFVLSLYVLGRTIAIKFNYHGGDAMHRDVLVPVSLFALLFFCSLAIPFMTNDTRYFLPAVFISIFIFVTALGKDFMLLLPHVISVYKRTRSGRGGDSRI